MPLSRAKAGFDSRWEYKKVDWGKLLMRKRGLNEVKVMPIVKVDVHAPIFYFPSILKKLKFNLELTKEHLIFKYIKNK